MKHSRITSLKQVIMGYHLWRPINPDRVYYKIEQLKSFQKLYNMSHLKTYQKSNLRFPISFTLISLRSLELKQPKFV